MPLNSQKFAQFQEALNARITKCSLCESEDFSLELCGPVRAFMNPDPPHESELSFAALTCEGCGKVDFFDASHAGWTED